MKLEGTELRYAEVNFFSDLPSGGARQFLLSADGGASEAAPEVGQMDDANSIVLDTGRMKVRLPASRTVSAGEKAPGPIMQLEHGGKWIGSSQLVSPRRVVKSIATETVESGPLFITCRVTYQFEGGGVIPRR